jgi:chorismate mutase
MQVNLMFPCFTGKFVSESKFEENPSVFLPHILKPNRAALEALITRPDVERKLLLRLRKKAATYAQDFATDGEGNGSLKIDVDGVVDLYESYIIPLTKEVEVSLNLGCLCLESEKVSKVDYLLHRLDGVSQEEIDNLSRNSRV